MEVQLKKKGGRGNYCIFLRKDVNFGGQAQNERCFSTVFFSAERTERVVLLLSNIPGVGDKGFSCSRTA